jgi:5-formyltetrahydrofolate cyclo-ligase
MIRRRLRASTEADGVVAEAACRWVKAHPEAATIAVYAALPGEVDLLVLAAREPSRCWVLPRIEGDELRFHRVVRAEVDLVAGAFGILEPRDSLPEVAIAEIDAFFCPGLAFDVRGGRLGRGRGFYDRALAAARPGAWKIGVCRQFQVVADTFAEPHDVFMDQVICG